MRPVKIIGLCGALLLAVALPGKAHAKDLSASGGSIGVGNGAYDSAISSYGLTPEKIRKAMDGGNAEITDLSRQFDVTKRAVDSFLQIIGKNKVPPEKLALTLTRIARDYKGLQTQVRQQESQTAIPGGPPVKALFAQAAAENEQGQFHRARVLLEKIVAAQTAAAQKAAGPHNPYFLAMHSTYLLNAAAATALEGKTALIQLDYRQASELFGKAARLLPSGYSGERAYYLSEQAGALYRQGDEKRDQQALRDAIATIRSLLDLYPRKRTPLDWATTQNNLGNALTLLGERESGTADLEAAIVAYKAALEERTRKRAPLDWATTQSNLANALTLLGEREKNVGKIREAIGHFDAALTVFNMVHDDSDLKMAQGNRARALAAMASLKN